MNIFCIKLYISIVLVKGNLWNCLIYAATSFTVTYSTFSTTLTFVLLLVGVSVELVSEIAPVPNNPLMIAIKITAIRDIIFLSNILKS